MRAALNRRVTGREMENFWLEIFNTIRSEFADIPDLETVTRIIVRLLLAGILGGLLGFEREQEGKSAGMRTHMLVALGAALFVLVPKQANVADADVTRVLQGIVVGIGFLGAGTIIKGNGVEEVRGLTTAAGIWLTAAVGTAAGMGLEATAVLSTSLAFVILAIVPRLSTRIQRRNNSSK